MRGLRSWVAMAAVVLPLLSGCKPDKAVRTGAEIGDGGTPAASKGSRKAVDVATAGSVSGVVRFQGKAPARIKIDMTMDPVCEMKAGDNYSEQYVVKDGKLANVFVYVKSGPGAAMNAAATSAGPVVLDQKGCRYVPHVIGVMEGEPVEFRNSDPTMHNVHTMPTVVGNEVVDVSEGPNGPAQVRRFGAPELMMPVRCNNHPWMNAFVNVSATPFFAVTGEDGTFALTGLPPGDYVLGAVQEKLGEQTMHVVVQPHQSSVAEFTFAMK